MKDKIKNNNKRTALFWAIGFGLLAGSTNVYSGLFISPAQDSNGGSEHQNNVPLTSNPDQSSQRGGGQPQHSPSPLQNPSQSRDSQGTRNPGFKNAQNSPQGSSQGRSQGNSQQGSNNQNPKEFGYGESQNQQGNQNNPRNRMASGDTAGGGDYLMSERDDRHTLMRYGKDVPLAIAFDNLIPNSGQWSINIEDGLEEEPVSWEGGQTWENVLSLIASENDLEIFINHDEKAVGASFDSDTAKNLAYRDPKVWSLDGDKGLRQNIDAWAEKEGWEVHYSSELGDINYSVPDTMIFGELLGKNGAIDQVLMGLNRTADIPLKAEFAMKNKQIYISKMGHDKEMF